MGALDDDRLGQAVRLIAFADPDPTGRRMVLADDLLSGRAEGTRANLEAADRRLAEALADESVSNADLKGVLNRASGKTWGVDYDRRFTAREFVEEMRRAVQDYLQRHPGLR